MQSMHSPRVVSSPVKGNLSVHFLDTLILYHTYVTDEQCVEKVDTKVTL